MSSTSILTPWAAATMPNRSTQRCIVTTAIRYPSRLCLRMHASPRRSPWPGLWRVDPDVLASWWDRKRYATLAGGVRTPLDPDIIVLQFFGVKPAARFVVPIGGASMHVDQTTRRRFIKLLGSAAVTPARLAVPASTAVLGLLAGTMPDAFASERDSLLHKSRALGAPMAAVERSVAISRQPVFLKKDALAIFDISQPSASKRFYVLDFKSGQVTAHYAAHGKSNGPHARAVKFKGFQSDLDMVPLGPLKTAHSEVMDHYRTIVDRYDGTVYPNMIVVALEGAAPYNNYIDHTPPYKWIIHPSWYTTTAFRSKNNGMLGRSNGCITLDPLDNNQLVTRLQDGALIYVTVGNDPIEQYL